jgi:hypothetical protein
MSQANAPRSIPALGLLVACAALAVLALPVQAAQPPAAAKAAAPTPAAEAPPASAEAAKAPASPSATKPAPKPATAKPATATPTPAAPPAPPGERLTDEGDAPVRQPEARNPLGYPESIGDGPSVLPAFPRRVDDLEQVPGGLDPNRVPEHAEDPEGLLAWFEEPFPASPCDRNLVDPAWMGPGEYAYHKSGRRCWCSRDHTRMFRMNYMGRLWLAPEVLFWSTSGNSLPALVTSSPAGTPAAQAGVIGQPGTTILSGNDWAPGTFRPGGRITVGYWLDPTQHDGIDAQYFQLADATSTGTFTNQGGAVLLARPYVDATTGQQASVLLPPPNTLPADPALLARSITATQDTSWQGFDLLYRRSLCCDLLHRRWLVGGYRFLQLNDNLSVVDQSTVSTGSPGGYPSTSILATDLFSARTQFHGGELGLIEKWWYERWGFQLLGKMALGGSFYDTDIGGMTTTTVTPSAGGTPSATSTAGSVLSQPTNIGNYGSSSFAAVGELGATVDWAIWSQCRLSVGYTFLWWSQVARAASQVDPSVNPTQFPPGTLSGPAAPAYHLRTTDFWGQGLNLGFEYQF